MNPIAYSSKEKLTYIIATLIIIYATVFRGFGANDWAGAAGMISTALIGICLQNAISGRSSS